MVAAYKGPHTIILNRNETNLGIGGHVNKIARIAQGEWRVGAAGDDVSLPTRVETVMSRIKGCPDVVGICSGWKRIDENGLEVSQTLGYQTPQQEVLRNNVDFDQDWWLHGATAMWRKDLFTKFPPLLEGVICEDLVCSFRAHLCGKTLTIPEVLVLWRLWDGNVSGARVPVEKTRLEQVLLREQHGAKWFRAQRLVYRQMIIDRNHFQQSHQTIPEGIPSIETLGALERRSEVIGFFNEWSFVRRVSLLFKRDTDRKWCFPRLFGRRCYTYGFVVLWSVKRFFSSICRKFYCLIDHRQSQRGCEK